MSKQLLNEKTFEPASVAVFTAEKPVVKTMTYGGTAARAFFLVVVTIGFAMIGWRSAADVVAASGMWFFLGYLLLIGISIAAAAMRGSSCRRLPAAALRGLAKVFSSRSRWRALNASKALRGM